MPRQTLDLCGLWRFQPDPGREGEQAGYQQLRVQHTDVASAQVVQCSSQRQRNPQCQRGTLAEPVLMLGHQGPVRHATSLAAPASHLLECRPAPAGGRYARRA